MKDLYHWNNIKAIFVAGGPPWRFAIELLLSGDKCGLLTPAEGLWYPCDHPGNPDVTPPPVETSIAYGI
jgi:hypothetical protein